MAFKTKKLVKSIIEYENEQIEIESPVPEYDPPPLGNAPTRIIGKDIVRLIGPDKVTGRARYTFDMNLPNMLIGKIWRIPVAKARITSVDLSAARAMPGVHTALQVAADGTVLDHAGAQVAAVAAETEEAAYDALQAITVTYEELPHSVTMARSRQSDAPQAIDGPNVKARRIRGGDTDGMTRGDVDAGFRQADKTVEHRYVTQVECHQPLETHGSVAYWDGENLIVYDSTQAVHGVRSALARAMRLPEEQVRVICEHIGGGFGGKLAMGDYTIVAAKLAKDAGRPVKIMLDRKAESLVVGNRPDCDMTIKVGAKSDGTLTALEMTYYTSGGNRRGDAPETPVIEIYQIPNLKIQGSDVFVNTGGARPTRAPGFPQGTFALEMAMDELATALDMNPLALRRKNYTSKSNGGTGDPWSSKGLDKCYDRGAEEIGWSHKWRKPGTSKGRYLRGLGVGTQTWAAGMGRPGELVDVLIHDSGQVEVRSGTQDIGTGTRTILAQVVAEELGLQTHDILVKVGDSRLPKCGGSGGSMTAPGVCPAARAGAAEAKMKLLALAARHLNVSADQLETDEGRIRLKTDPAKSISFVEVARHIGDTPIIGKGVRAPNPSGYKFNPWGAQFAEVEIDTVTGKVKVLKVAAVHEIGRVINPLLARNQIIGGVAQGVSYAILEQRIMDENTGTMANANLRDYKILPASDVPEIIAIALEDFVDPVLNNLGMKGLGEPPRIPTAAAIACAVYNAIGVPIRTLPITPDKVLKALEEREDA